MNNSDILVTLSNNVLSSLPQILSIPKKVKVGWKGSGEMVYVGIFNFDIT